MTVRTFSRHSALLVAIALTTACATLGPTAGPSPSAATQAGASMQPAAPTPSLVPSSAPTAADDLDRLLQQLEAIHPEPFHGVRREEFVAALEALKARITRLTPEEASVELMRTTAMLSREGRDGHQFLLSLDSAERPMLPVRLYEFEEGLYITAARPPYESLVGSRVLELGGHPIEEVLAAVEPLVPRDGPATVPGFRPMFLVRTVVLRGLGLIGDGPVELTVENDADERTVLVEPMPAVEFAEWAGHGASLPTRPGHIYLDDRDTHFWTEYLPASGTLYVHLDAVQSIPLDDIDAFRSRATQQDVSRVVFDLRQNGGGENGTYGRLLRTLQDDLIDRPGRFFVMTDRLTFSAASNLATELEQTTSAIFVGEAMGGGLNFWNDVEWVRLGALPIPSEFGVSTRYWQFSTPDDSRLTIEPDIAVPTTARDYFGGRDAALEAVESHPLP